MGPETFDWAIFGLFVWGFVALLGGRRRRRPRRWLAPPPDYRQPASAAGPPLPVPPPPAPEPPPPVARLPIDVQVKVEQIKRKVEVLLQHAGRFPTGSEDLYILRRTVEDYLPATIDAYLAIPAASAGGPPVTPEGRSALQVLQDQLALLDAKMDEIAQDLQRQDMDRLLANGRFLEERFGGSSAAPTSSSS